MKTRLAPLLLSLALGALVATPAQAQKGPGDLLVAPTRLVFEGRQRTAELTLVNTGSSAATYRISFVQLRMNEEGGTKEVATTDIALDERFSDDLIRYSPRQVTLEPNVAQTVRLQLRKPAELAEGEYRSHLLFRAIPPEPIPAADADPTQLSIKLTAVYGVSIPVIVRHGETWAKATLERLELVPAAAGDAGPVLRVRMGRTGNRSLYGNFTVTFTPEGGKARVVGLANGVAVYVPNPSRVAGIPLRPPSDTVLRNGVLHVRYSRPDKAGEVIAEADLSVP